MLKAITASLLMEQVLAPNFKFKTKLPDDESKHIAGEFKIKGYKEPSSKMHISELPDSDAGVVPDTFAMRFSRV